MAAQYTVLTEGFLPATGKLLRTYPGAVVSSIVATGAPEEMKRLAAQLNEAEALKPTEPPAPAK